MLLNRPLSVWWYYIKKEGCVTAGQTECLVDCLLLKFDNYGINLGTIWKIICHLMWRQISAWIVSHSDTKWAMKTQWLTWPYPNLIQQIAWLQRLNWVISKKPICNDCTIFHKPFMEKLVKSTGEGSNYVHCLKIGCNKKYQPLSGKTSWFFIIKVM